MRRSAGFKPALQQDAILRYVARLDPVGTKVILSDMTKTEEKKTKTISVKFPVRDLHKIPGNFSQFFRDAAYEKFKRMEQPKWKPKTALGKKLMMARQKFIKSGGELLDSDGIARELRERSGGLRD